MYYNSKYKNTVVVEAPVYETIFIPILFFFASARADIRKTSSATVNNQGVMSVLTMNLEL